MQKFLFGILGTVSRSSSSDKVVFKKSMSVLSILLGYQLKRRKRRKRVVLKNRCKIFRDNIIKVCTGMLKSMTLNGIGTSIRE